MMTTDFGSFNCKKKTEKIYVDPIPLDWLKNGLNSVRIHEFTTCTDFDEI